MSYSLKRVPRFAVCAAVACGLALQSGADESALPEGYSPIEHVMTVGNQYLDTGYYPTTNTIIDADIQMADSFVKTDNANLFGAAEGNRIFAVNFSNSDSNRLLVWCDLQYGKGGSIQDIYGANSYNGQRVKLGFDSTTGTFIYGGMTRAKCSTPTAAFTSAPLYIAAYYNADTQVVSPFRSFYMNIFSWKIFSGSILERDYVPCCRDSDGSAGLYDLVHGTFNPSDGEPFLAGSGKIPVSVGVRGGGRVSATLDGEEVLGQRVHVGSKILLTAIPDDGYEFLGWAGNVISAGPCLSAALELEVDEPMDVTAVFARRNRAVPAGYTRLEFVETSGSQYLDTGYHPCKTTRIDASVEMTGRFDAQKNLAFFGCREVLYCFTVNYGNGASGDSLFPWFCKVYEKGGANVGITAGVDAYNGKRVALCFDAARGLFTYGGVGQWKCEKPVGRLADGRFCIAGIDVEGEFLPFGGFGLRIYHWRISEGPVPLMDFVPCRRDADGAIGLYDLVGELFCESDGESAFIPGADWGGKEWNPHAVGYFPGGQSSDYVSPGVTSSLSSFSVSIWVKDVVPGSHGSGGDLLGALFSQGALGGSSGFCCHVAKKSGSGSELLAFQTRNPFDEIDIDWTDEATDGLWHMVTATYDGASHRKCLYIDGKLVGESTTVLPSPVSTESFAIGARINGGSPGYPVKGYLAEVSLWNRALAKNEVKAMRYGPITGKESGLIGYWPLTGDRRLSPDRVANGSMPHDGFFSSNAKLVEGEVEFLRRPGMLLLVQ